MKKIKPTLQDYTHAGAMFRLCHCLLLRILNSPAVSPKDWSQLNTSIRRFEIVRSRTEDGMFNDFPELGNSYLNVFYGDMDEEPRSEVDADQLQIMRELMREVFGDNVIDG